MEAAQNHERHKKNGQNPIHMRLNGKTIYIYRKVWEEVQHALICFSSAMQ
jgi:hypothetical protein